MKLPMGRLGSLRPERARMTASATALTGFVLADHALVQLVFQVQQLLHFAFEQLGHRDAGPAADDFGDVLLVDLFLDEPRPALLARQARFRLLQLALEAGELAVLQLGGVVEVVLPLGLLDLDLGLLDLLAQLARSF